MRRQATAALLLGLTACGDGRAARHAYAIPGERDPAITVEVLNVSGRPGVARAGALVLRRAGIDVVYFGNGIGDADSTQILVRRGSLAAGEHVRQALRLGVVRLEPDSGRLLDVSVLLGRDFTPRLEFHP
jgi:hypothetical protein